MSADADWNAALSRTTAGARAIANATRALVRRLDPAVVEVIWPHQGTIGWGIGPKKMTEHYAYLAVHPEHVNLGFYRGASLADPAKLLGGAGKAMRHMKLASTADLAKPAVSALLKAARAERVAALAKPATPATKKPAGKAPPALEPALVPIRDAFAGDRRVASFKSTSLCVDKKVFAMLSKGDLVVKLPAARVTALIASGDGKAWDPGHGRTMKEWVAIPAKRARTWVTIAKEARAFVGA